SAGNAPPLCWRNIKWRPQCVSNAYGTRSRENTPLILFVRTFGAPCLARRVDRFSKQFAPSIRQSSEGHWLTSRTDNRSDPAPHVDELYYFCYLELFCVWKHRAELHKWRMMSHKLSSAALWNVPGAFPIGFCALFALCLLDYHRL